ncbi:hypothetical protein MHAE_04795 [Mycobacterium haemophilum DSM 44634]|nr:hypothetical protein B586_20040 [Mycobacterium haemophilum DSM 44634]
MTSGSAAAVGAVAATSGTAAHVVIATALITFRRPVMTKTLPDSMTRAAVSADVHRQMYQQSPGSGMKHE